MFLSSQTEEPVLFRWKLKAGDDLELNEYHKVEARQGLKVVKREDKNRILLRVNQCAENICEFSGIFDTYTKFPAVDPAFFKDKTYYSKFRISDLGQYYVPAEYAMPNLRSLPTFALKPVVVGETWEQFAGESFQFTNTRIEIPVRAKYVYNGIGNWEFGKLKGQGSIIEYSYNLAYKSPSSSINVPEKIFGFAKGKIFFDSEAGIPQYKHVQLVYTFVYSNGVAQEMAFNINGVYNKQRSLTDPDKDRIAEEVRSLLDAKDPARSENAPKNGNGLDWPDWEGAPTKKSPVEVRKSEEGVTLSLDSLLFDTDRSELKAPAKVILDKIAKVLKKYPEKEIRISGHTDDRGSQEYNQKLSQERALSVLQELRDQHDIEEKRMSYKGYGKSKPITDNSSEESRAKNRRVDITIVLD
nr:OmpA family protein [Leptospira perolatii]